MMDTFETLYTLNPVVACDGGKGGLGHPRVYLHMGEDAAITCPYCSRHYVLRKEEGKAAGGHH